MALANSGFATPLSNVARSRLPRTLRVQIQLTVRFGHERKNGVVRQFRSELYGGGPLIRVSIERNDDDAQCRGRNP